MALTSNDGMGRCQNMTIVLICCVSGTVAIEQGESKSQK